MQPHPMYSCLLKRLFTLKPALIGLLCLLMLAGGKAMAQMAARIILPGGGSYDITGHNASRGDEALILYDASFGPSTRTNGYGVEVIAVPAAQRSDNGLPYEVKQITRVWDCMKQSDTATEATADTPVCGNATIPENGIVLSATGSKRELLKNLKPGDILTLQEEWFHQAQAAVNVIDPTPENNPVGSGFPGYRASNQMLAYDAGFGRPSTGTNEFGFEVTVENGIVTAQEGSDSTIPAPNGFVLSGHGRGRSWLIANAPLGAKIALDPVTLTVTSTVDFDTYAYQFDKRWYASPCTNALLAGKRDAACEAIRDSRDQALRLNAAGRTSLAAAGLTEALERLNRRAWTGYTAFSKDSLRGAWHRPVEKSRAAIGETLDRLKAAGLNAVFLETFFHGYTIFPSNTYKEYGFDTPNPKFKDADVPDLLQAWVEEAHKRDMQVHVWFQTFYGGTKAFMPPGPILAKKPEWANVQFAALIPEAPPGTEKGGVRGQESRINGPAQPAQGANGKTAIVVDSSTPPPPPKLISPAQPVPSNLELGAYFLDPANPAVKDFLNKLAVEIASRYKVDGLQLDYIRYPASFPPDRFSYRRTTWGYSTVARNTFKSLYGVDPTEIDPKDPRADELWKDWNDFQTEEVTGFVNRVTQAVRAARPDIKISAAVFPDAGSALLVKHQDWRAWAQRGWIDFFAPMTLTSAMKVVDHDTRSMVSATGGKIPVYSGIFGPFNDNTAEHVLQQIDTARAAGAEGYVLFDTAHLSSRMLEALKAMQNPQPVYAEAGPSAPAPVPPQKPARKKKRFLFW